MPPKSIWNGTITFGLVNVPVKLYSATESKTVHFHEVHARTARGSSTGASAPRRTRRSPYEEVVKGYEVSDGEYVVLDQGRDQGRGRRPRQGRSTIERVRRRRARSTRSSTRRPTTSARATTARTPTALLREALRASPAAPASGASRSTTASTWSRVRALDGRARAAHACASTTRSSTPATSTSPSPASAPAKREVEMAGQLVDVAARRLRARATTRTPTARRCCELIKRKAKGEEIDAAEPRSPQQGRRPDGRAARRASGAALMPRAALERLAELRPGQRAGARWSAPRATSTSTSASCTRRTARRSSSGASARGGRRGRLGGDRARLRPRRQAGGAHRRGARRRSQPRKTRTIDIEAFVDARRRRPDLLRPPLLPRAGRRERGHAARLPAAGRGDGRRPSARRSGAS